MELQVTQITNDTYRQVFLNATEGIIVVDHTARVILANPTSEAMFGYQKDEILQLTIEQLIPSRFRAHHVGLRSDFIGNPTPRRMGIGRDLTALRKDGTEFPVEVSLSNTAVDGKVFVVAFIVNITQRKIAEEALKRSEEQLLAYAGELEKKVQSRTQALNHTIEELERTNVYLQEQIEERKRAEEEARRALEKQKELNDLKTKFVSIASHEFRTPLSVILSSASLIQRYNEAQQADKVSNHTHRIKDSVNQLTMILNDFLSLGRLEEGRIEINYEEISLPAFFKGLEEEISPLLKEEQKFKVKYNLDSEKITTDTKVLRNVLLNLISNAIKYSAPATTITVVVGGNENLTQIEVIDQGIGIPESEIKHIFDRFFRASNASNIQGTGLGLNIVRRYLDLLGGTIDFTSEVGKGSKFRIKLSGKNDKDFTYRG